MPSPTYTPTTSQVNKYTNSTIYSRYIADVAAYESNASAVVYSYFRHDGVLVAGSAQGYHSFATKSLAIPFDNAYFSSVKAAYVSYHQASAALAIDPTSAELFSCGQPSIVQQIVNHLLHDVAADLTVSCDGYMWTSAVRLQQQQYYYSILTDY
jgi:hypothetical protein